MFRTMFASGKHAAGAHAHGTHRVRVRRSPLLHPNRTSHLASRRPRREPPRVLAFPSRRTSDNLLSPPPSLPLQNPEMAPKMSFDGKENRLWRNQPPCLGTPSPPKRLSPCDLSAFDVGRVLGTGSFGRVSFAKHISSGALVAIKVMSKSEVIRARQVEHVRAERQILGGVDHPFIVAFLGSSQDAQCVRFVLEYVAGGEFFTHLRRAGRFSDDVARFYAAEIVLALEYLHADGIAYRDLKPENLLLDAEGHVKITDFGFAKRVDGARTYTLCGTPDYLAPEMIKNEGHGVAVDWWALGVLIFEMLVGYPPFFDEDPIGTYRKILDDAPAFPPRVGKHARDVSRRLMHKDVTRRIGNLRGGSRDVVAHAWFAGVDWAATLRRETVPPVVPNVSAADDTSNFDDYSDAPPMTHHFELDLDEQELFENI